MPCITLDDLLRDFELKQMPLLKLDIEGAEIAVLADLVHHRIFPEQILVEFDELTMPCERARRHVEESVGLLLEAGYHLAHIRAANFLFVR